MNKQNQLNFSKASLVGLQAELARKKAEAKSYKNNLSNNKTKLEIKSHIPEKFKCTFQLTTDTTTETDREITDSIENQARDTLQAKSELYAKLRNKELVTEESSKFLVDFTSSSSPVRIENEESDSDPESEWVTFVDSLGRSRTCLRSDLPYYKNLDTKLRVDNHSAKIVSEKNEQVKIIPDEVLKWDERREELRKLWDEEEKRLNEKKDIHYQDVLFNEARTHGVGYFSFSQDENERQKQQEALKKLREETEKNRTLRIDLKERRKQQMKQRIDAAKKRKRLQMGLLPEEDVDELNLQEVEKSNESETEIEKHTKLENKVEEFLRSMERATYIRPWDVGKDGFKAPVLTQNEWNETQRAKRMQEFAPPTCYKTDVADNNNVEYLCKEFKNKDDRKLITNELEHHITNKTKRSYEQNLRNCTEIPPPLSYESSSFAKPKKCNIEDSIDAGLNYLKNKVRKNNKDSKKDILYNM